MSLLSPPTLLPAHELQQRLDELDRDAHWFVYCEHGVRSVAACQFVTANGFSKVTNIRGGMANWMANGLQFARG